MLPLRFRLLASFVLASLVPTPVAAQAGRATPVDFGRDVLPILQKHCHQCHGPDKDRGGLRLTNRELVLHGGDSGPAVAPGKAAESLLLRRVTALDPRDRMPPKGE